MAPSSAPTPVRSQLEVSGALSVRERRTLWSPALTQDQAAQSTMQTKGTLACDAAPRKDIAEQPQQPPVEEKSSVVAYSSEATTKPAASGRTVIASQQSYRTRNVQSHLSETSKAANSTREAMDFVEEPKSGSTQKPLGITTKSNLNGSQTEAYDPSIAALKSRKRSVAQLAQMFGN